MAKATVTLANGTIVNIDGTTAEVKELLSFYGSAHAASPERQKPPARPRAERKTAPKAQTDEVSINEIVKHVKNCDEAGDIESRILDTTSQVNRILLPLLVVQGKEKGSGVVS